jgi:hypothetical protein
MSGKIKGKHEHHNKSKGKTLIAQEQADIATKQ